ncbi:MAG: class I SAM-dependent methyltransferase [Coriobacteriia bacterium]|nr:class I SAM-dependent methyltransferase [Coriobacteriia bacterium]
MQEFTSRKWYYDDRIHVGIDYGSAEEVRLYEDEFGQGANRSDEAKELIDALRLTNTSTVLDIGTATGTLAIELAKLCKQVHAIDISEPMLECAKAKAKKLELSNIEFVYAGFLSYQYADETMDAVFTKYAFHHLPDHWKFVALKRIYDILKPGGKFYLKDAILSVDIQEFYDFADEWVALATKGYGQRGEEAAVLFVRDEYPTYVWIVEEMLGRVGFIIDQNETQQKMHTTIVCTKP